MDITNIAYPWRFVINMFYCMYPVSIYAFYSACYDVSGVGSFYHITLMSQIFPSVSTDWFEKLCYYELMIVCNC